MRNFQGIVLYEHEDIETKDFSERKRLGDYRLLVFFAFVW